MKRFLKSLFSLLFVISFACMLSACKNSDNKKNKEFEEFSTAAVNIMSNYTTASEDNVITTPAARAESVMLSSSSGGSTNERLFEELSAYAYKEIVTNVNYYYMDVMEQVFATTLGSGDVLTKTYKVKSFFGLKTNIVGNSEYGNQTESFVINKVNGDYVLNYYYKFEATSPMAESSERFAYAIIDYNAIDDYKVKLLAFELDFSNYFYAEADSNYNLSYITKSTWQQDITWSAVAAKGILSCYETDREEFVRDFYLEYYENLNTQISYADYIYQLQQLPSQASYTIDEEDVYAAFEKYIDRSASNVVQRPVAFINQDGVAVNADLSYVNETEEGVEILPTSAYGIDCNLLICPSIKKVLIPSNITKIVDKRYNYESLSLYFAYEKAPYGSQKDSYLAQYEALTLEYQNTRDDPKWEEWVEVSAEYVKERFTFVQYEQREDGLMNPDLYYVDCEVDVAEGSTLFTKKEDGNIYATVDGEEILIFVNNFDIFTDEIDNVELTFADNGIRSVANMVISSHIKETTGSFATTTILNILAKAKYSGDIFTKVKNVTITSEMPINLSILAYDVNYNVTERYNFDSVTINMGANAMLMIDPDIVASIGTLTISEGAFTWFEISCNSQTGSANTFEVGTLIIEGENLQASISGSYFICENILADDSVIITDNRSPAV